MAVMRPEAIMKSIIPVVMAGIIAIYGVVVAVLIAGQLSSTGYTLYQVLITHIVTINDPHDVDFMNVSHCPSINILRLHKCYWAWSINSATLTNSFSGLRSLGRWPFSRTVRAGCWLRCRGGGRRRGARHGPAAQTLRGNDPDLDLRWGVGSVRSHCGHLSLRQEISATNDFWETATIIPPTSSFMIYHCNLLICMLIRTFDLLWTIYGFSEIKD